MSSTVWFQHEGSSVKLTVWDSTHATLSNLFSIKRNRGYAKVVMQELIDYADLWGLYVLLEVQQFHYADKESPDNSGLKKFYAKFGFVDCGRNMMQREPSQELQAS